MGETTGISWADHTFNPWWGCVEVGGSPACGPTADYPGSPCYAKVWDKRTGGDHWGADKDRRWFGDQHWAGPVKWNRDAEKQQTRRRVFCMSMGDVFEGRPDQRPHLARLWKLILFTPWLDWMLLTKRPQLIAALYPMEWQRNPPPNVWLGATTETQFWFDIRWEHLKRIPAAVHWVSMEPLFEHISLPTDFLRLGKRAWVITGGQSGGAALPMHPGYARGIRDQCVAAGVPYHHKQNGEWVSVSEVEGKGPHCSFPDGAVVRRVGKDKAGRSLDGVIWNEFPNDVPSGHIRSDS